MSICRLVPLRLLDTCVLTFSPCLLRIRTVLINTNTFQPPAYPHKGAEVGDQIVARTAIVSEASQLASELVFFTYVGIWPC